MVARKLKLITPRVRVHGIGGPRMARAGVRIESSLFSSGVIGWTGAAGRIPAVIRLLRRLKRRWTRRPARALLLIDNPGFNLRLARVAVKCGVPVYYYVCPQVWAWGAQRLIVMRRLVKQAFAVLPFEEPLYQAFGIRARFVGHPLLELIPRLRRVVNARRYRAPRILMLPGSRRDEIARHLPVFVQGARVLSGAELPPVFTVAVTPETEGQVRSILASAADLTITATVSPGYAMRARADLAWTASGTATLEMGLLGVPQIVVYRMNWLNWLIVRMISQVPFASLVNLLAGRRAVPELLQSDLKVRSLVDLSRKLLRPSARRAARLLGRDLERILSGPGASRTVAGELAAKAGGGAG